MIKNFTPAVESSFFAQGLYTILMEKFFGFEDWWNSLKDYFCIIDNSSLDLFWYKYDWDYEYRFLRTYSDKFSRAIDFQDWYHYITTLRIIGI